ncbi:MAG: hypothetical protein GY898_33755 [Proteobacteria bacterium]|nr:hypothetical protein [Pseudomonadota bacterium]
MNRTRLLLMLLVVSLVACAVPEGGTLEPIDGVDEDVWSVELILDVPASLNIEEPEAEGLIEAPEDVAVFVGEELLLDLALRDPSVGRILPADLPTDATFAADELAAHVSWEPKITDVGQHDFVFLVVDGEDDSLILGTTVVLVSVLPRNSFIEYGF